MKPAMRAIAELRTDGGTAFCLDVGMHDWPSRWKNIVDALQRDRSLDVEAYERREGIRIALPLPPMRRGQTDIVFPDDVVEGFRGPPPVAEVIVEGPHRERLTFHVRDHCYTKLAEQADPDTGEVRWRVRCEAKARTLYADGLGAWMRRWLGLWSWLMSGRWCRVEDMAALGWRTTQWHLNSDFVGIDFADEDARNFVGVRKFTRYGRGQTVAEHRSRGGIVKVSESTTSCPWVQTLALGRKSSDSQLVIYRKGDQLREAKNVEPGRSMYAPMWRAFGWEEGFDSDPLRVELRLRKKGLEYVRPNGGGTVWNFRDPVMLLNDAAVRELWWYHMWRRRLIKPDVTRKRRAEVDPRWSVVQRLGVPKSDVRQLPRKVREMTRDERVAIDMRDGVMAGIRYASRSGIEAASLLDVGDVLVAMGRHLQRGDGPAELASLAKVPDLRAAVERAAASSQFFRKLALEHFESLAAELDAARGRQVQRRRVWEETEEDDSDT